MNWDQRRVYVSRLADDEFKQKQKKKDTEMIVKEAVQCIVPFEERIRQTASVQDHVLSIHVLVSGQFETGSTWLRME